MDGHISYSPFGALFQVTFLVDATFKAIASTLMSGLALSFDPDNQLYLFCHHWGSLSTLDSSCLWFDLCLGPHQLWHSPPVCDPTESLGPHELALTRSYSAATWSALSPTQLIFQCGVPPSSSKGMYSPNIHTCFPALTGYPALCWVRIIREGGGLVKTGRK